MDCWCSSTDGGYWNLGIVRPCPLDCGTCRRMGKVIPMRYLRYLIVSLTALALISCSRDPAYLKQKYLDSGNKNYEKKSYKKASLLYRKALEKNRKFGIAYYKLALTDLELKQVAN